MLGLCKSSQMFLPSRDVWWSNVVMHPMAIHVHDLPRSLWIPLLFGWPSTWLCSQPITFQPTLARKYHVASQVDGSCRISPSMPCHQGSDENIIGGILGCTCLTAPSCSLASVSHGIGSAQTSGACVQLRPRLASASWLGWNPVSHTGLRNTLLKNNQVNQD